jgi:hypothetical protein
MNFFVKKNLRIARARAYALTVASRKKPAEFWSLVSCGAGETGGRSFGCLAVGEGGQKDGNPVAASSWTHAHTRLITFS